MCVGNAAIAFMKGKRRLATITFHHSQRLRWHDGPWKGDAELTTEAKTQVPLWLMKEGFPGFEEERQRQIKDAMERKSEFEAFLSFFPAAKQQGSFQITVPVSSSPAFQTATARASGPEVLRCVESCFALGVLMDRNWFMSERLRDFARANCREASGGAFLEAVELVRSDPPALLGAARLFFREGFKEKVAGADRLRCSLLLADAELQQSYPGNEDYVIRVLGSFQSPEAADYLRLVALGEKGIEIEPGFCGQEPGIIDQPSNAFLFGEKEHRRNAQTAGYLACRVLGQVADFSLLGRRILAHLGSAQSTGKGAEFGGRPEGAKWSARCPRTASSMRAVLERYRVGVQRHGASNHPQQRLSVR